MRKEITLEEILKLSADDQVVALAIGDEFIVGNPQSMIGHLLPAVLQGAVRCIASGGKSLNIWL